jgi:hypothetical protein
MRVMQPSHLRATAVRRQWQTSDRIKRDAVEKDGWYQIARFCGDIDKDYRTIPAARARLSVISAGAPIVGSTLTARFDGAADAGVVATNSAAHEMILRIQFIGGPSSHVGVLG